MMRVIQPACNVVEGPIGSLGVAKNVTWSWETLCKRWVFRKNNLPTQIKKFEEFEGGNVQNAKVCGTSPFLTVDKTLYPYRDRIWIKQYNSAKPEKHGLL